jgi:cytoskeleton protein RodZ
MAENKFEKSAGLFLKEARTAKNISLEEVSKRTRIHLNILKSIEQDDYKSLSGIYAKSFLKLYAEYLGLDKDDVIRRFQNVSSENEALGGRRVRIPGDEQGIKAPSFSLNTAKIFNIFKKINFKFVGIVLLGLVLAWGMVWSFKHYRPSHRAVKKEVALKSTFNKKRSLETKPMVSKETLRQAGDSDVLKADEPKKQPLTKSLATPAGAEESLSAQVPQKIVLVVRAKDKCWLQVRVDGKPMFQGMLGKGMAETWQANDKIELMIGNAGNVALELNGKLLQKIGRPGQTLKHVIITKSGLSVRK